MSRPHARPRLSVVLGAATALVGGGLVALAQDATPPRTPQAWTMDEAMGRLLLNPKDVYLQYVAAQLARREGRDANEVLSLRARIDRSERQMGRREQVDLFSLFTGALAVQESLQLDAMRGAPQDGGGEAAVDVASLAGPEIKSHPWEEMLGGRKPEVSPLAMRVPDDFYVVEFRSLSKLLEAADAADLWGTHLFNQTFREARTQRAGDRLKDQLAVETQPLLRPFYDLVVEEVAVTGSDLYLREGSDATLLFRFRQPQVFQSRMDGFLANAEKRPGAKRETGEILGVPYVHVATPDRAVHVFSAYPEPGLHVRSNSKAAFQRVLEAIQGKGADGKPVRRLGETPELSYIRTLMPRGAKEEDGFIYLSDPFIRRLVGPTLKLTERRRMICYNHLRMIGHAALLHRTDFGRVPPSLAALAETKCAPGLFGTGGLACPDGGTYALAADGAAGICSRHGHPLRLTPCLELAVARVTAGEAAQYAAFLNEYKTYWRTFFDPIAIRVQVAPKRYRLETVILPLIDNSVYTSLAAALGGAPGPMDVLPVPPRTIFSVAVRLDKEMLLKADTPVSLLLRDLGVAGQSAPQLGVDELVSKGLGGTVGLHVYDAVPTFDFNLASFLGQALGSFGGGRMGSEMLPVSVLIAALNAPIYLSLPVQDEKVVDAFLDRLDGLLAFLARRPMEGGMFGIDQDFYRLPRAEGPAARAYGLKFGPLRWRFFWARIGKGLYVATKSFILDDLATAEAKRAAAPAGAEDADAGPAAHAMVRVRARSWDQVLPDYRLGWAENNREACLDNLGPLSSVARALAASGAAPAPGAAHALADALYGVHFFCPENGRYEVVPDRAEVVCSVHGSALAPRQPAAPDEGGALGRLLKELAGATASLTFLEDGLRAVVTIERK